MHLTQTTYDRYIGVDPGVSGAIAVLWPNGDICGVMPMPSTDHGMVDAAQMAVDHGTLRGIACIEQVSAGVFGMPGRKQGAVSAFTFGGAYRGIRVALIAAGIEVIDVRPQVWQTAMECRTKGDKRISQAKAQELFPTYQITHQCADALLLAEYCRRLHR